MPRYSINLDAHGYDKLTTDMETLKGKSNSTVAVGISKANNEEIGKHYKAVEELLKNKNRVMLISSNDENELLKPLASLMVTYNNYDIYITDEIGAVDADYLREIESRTPSLEEVQSYIGGDVTAYNDLMTILFGIQSLVLEGKEDKLRAFLDEHVKSIEMLSTTFNGMKKKCDMFNSDELFDKVATLKADADKLGDTIKQQNEKLMDVKQERDKYKVQLEDASKENQRLKSANAELESSANGGAIIRSYNELSTQLINCKAKIVLYFKEVSYVSYVNTLIVQIMSVLEAYKLKTKLLVYDCNMSIYGVYKPLPIVTGQDYISMKDTLVKKTKSFVVAEPNQSIINDILSSDQAFDVVVVYDRMKQGHDLVSGNNVSKFYVINSAKDFTEIASTLHINDTSWIITHANSSIENTKNGKPDKAFLDIPHVKDFSTMTESAKTNRYLRMITSFSKVALLDTIFKKSRISTLIKK